MSQPNLCYSSDNTSLEDVFKNRKTIFLAGPTPRSEDVMSWRPQAIAFLKEMGFTGDTNVVLIPERRDWKVKFDYFDQTEWESQAMEGCNVILFWIPRDLEKMPAFTTNVEFGRFVGRRRVIESEIEGPCYKVGRPYSVVYGRPDDAPNNRYLDWLYTKHCGTKPFSTLRDTVAEAIRKIGK